MDFLHSFHITAWHSPPALARILLVLSRRRIRAEEIRVRVADDPGFDEIEIRLRIDDAAAERLRHQFARVVEVIAVRQTAGLPLDRRSGPPSEMPFAAGD